MTPSDLGQLFAYVGEEPQDRLLKLSYLQQRLALTAGKICLKMTTPGCSLAVRGNLYKEKVNFYSL